MRKKKPRKSRDYNNSSYKGRAQNASISITVLRGDLEAFYKHFRQSLLDVENRLDGKKRVFPEDLPPDSKPIGD